MEASRLDKFLEHRLFADSERLNSRVRIPVIWRLAGTMIGLGVQLFVLLLALVGQLWVAAALSAVMAALWIAFLLPSFRQRAESNAPVFYGLAVAFSWQIGLWDLPGALYLWLALGPVVAQLVTPSLSLPRLLLGVLGLLTATAGYIASQAWLFALLVMLLGLVLLGAVNLVRRQFDNAVEQLASHQDTMVDQLGDSRTSAASYADQTRFLVALLDLIPFPIFSKGMDGRFLRANSSFGVVFDVDSEHISGKKNSDFLGPHNASTFAKIELDVLARDSMAAEETHLVHADGRLHDFIVYLMPFADHSPEGHGFIGVLIDITERKQKEEKLLRLNDTKDQLFSIISHDLRSPIGKMKQLLDIYVDDPGIFDRNTWDQVFQDLRKSADSVHQLLDNLLSWARSQQGEVANVSERFGLEPLVQDIFSLQKLLANDKRITLVHDLQLIGPAVTDKNLLSTILRNLVNNALKFTQPGGTVTVRARQTEDELTLIVEDNGVGMSPEAIETIVKKRHRVSTYGTGKEKGQGIGLSLCLDLCAQIGADLDIESVEGRGTKIRVTLTTTEL